MRIMLISAIVAATSTVAACGQQASSVDVGGNIPAAAARGFMAASSIEAAENHVGNVINSDGCLDRFPGDPALDQVMYLIEGQGGRIAVVAAHPFFEGEEAGEVASETLWLFESRAEWEESLKFALGWVESAGCHSRYTAEDGTVTVVGYRRS